MSMVSRHAAALVPPPTEGVGLKSSKHCFRHVPWWVHAYVAMPLLLCSHCANLLAVEGRSHLISSDQVDSEHCFVGMVFVAGSITYVCARRI